MRDYAKDARRNAVGRQGSYVRFPAVRNLSGKLGERRSITSQWQGRAQSVHDSYSKRALEMRIFDVRYVMAMDDMRMEFFQFWRTNEKSSALCNRGARQRASRKPVLLTMQGEFGGGLCRNLIAAFPIWRSRNLKQSARMDAQETQDV